MSAARKIDAPGRATAGPRARSRATDETRPGSAVASRCARRRRSATRSRPVRSSAARSIGVSAAPSDAGERRRMNISSASGAFLDHSMSERSRSRSGGRAAIESAARTSPMTTRTAAGDGRGANAAKTIVAAARNAAPAAGAAPARMSDLELPEVLGIELLEIAAQLLGLLLVAQRRCLARAFLLGGGRVLGGRRLEQFLVHEDRRLGAQRQRDRVRGPR